MIIDLLFALLMSGLLSVWRFYDGSEKSLFRARSTFHFAFLQTSTPAVLCLIAGLWAVVPYPVEMPEIGVNLLPLGAAALVFYLLIRGMPGWTHWGPNPHGAGMLLTYALPMFLCGALGLLVGLSPIGSVLTALGGLSPCVVYVLGSRLEEQNRWPFRLTAEECGRLSMGALVFPLPIL